MHKKTRLFTMRVSEEWLQGLREICARKARTISAHVERSVEITRLVDEILCHGRDDLDFVKCCLKKAALKLQKRGKASRAAVRVCK